MKALKPIALAIGLISVQTMAFAHSDSAAADKPQKMDLKNLISIPEDEESVQNDVNFNLREIMKYNLHQVERNLIPIAQEREEDEKL